MNETKLQELYEELPSFADSHETIKALIEKLPGSMKYKGENALKVLELAAVLVTCETADEEAKAIDELNEILR